MIDKSKFKIEGKTPEQIKEIYKEFLDNEEGQFREGYVSLTSSPLPAIAKKLYGVDSIFEITDVERINRISRALTEIIENEEDVNKRHNLRAPRCHIKKYSDFIQFCEVLKNKPIYYFAEDEDKPFISEENFMKIVTLLEKKKNIILEGAPGVGKTFLSRKIAYQLIGEKKDENIEMVQFHQSYSYEDFIQGIRPFEDGFTRRNGVFFEFCNKARRSPDKRFVFIIDEINRGNISKILGELMMLIEADKRSSKYAIKLTYSDNEDEKFYVPGNVYIIGCMNTADRSLAIVDYALRRRFCFCPIIPEFNDVFKNFLVSKGISEKNANVVISKVVSVNVEIASIDKGLEIGHSYFCKTEGADDFNQWWNDICEYELFPYIREICFDDEDRCRHICNKLKL